MAIFESLAAVSIALALGIPVLMERVLRPHYEDRFEQFRLYNRGQLLNFFEEALGKLRGLKSHEVMSPELYESMNRLITQWTTVNSYENKLTIVTSRRKYLFAGWMVSLALCLASINSSDFMVTPSIPLGGMAVGWFGIVFVYSMYYALQLYLFDEKLANFRRTAALPSGTIKLTVEPAIADRAVPSEKHIEITARLQGLLTAKQIPFVANPIIRKDDYKGVSPDFALPDADSPRYFIEVKDILTIQGSYGVAALGASLKFLFPNALTILVVAQAGAETRKFLTQRSWDYVFDATGLEQLALLVQNAKT